MNNKVYSYFKQLKLAQLNERSMQQGVKQGKKLSMSVYIILLMFNIAVCFDELVQ